jgi:protein-disulfide isomerase
MKEGSKLLEKKETTERPGSPYFVPVSILTAGFMIAASVIYAFGNRNANNGNPAQNNNQNQLANVGAVAAQQISGRDIVLGNSNAEVTLIEYADYQCPFCAHFFSQTEPLLKKDYVQTGKAKMVFRNYQFLGPESFKAAEAAECAKDQGKFWEYHDALYTAEETDGHENNGNLNRDLFVKLAGDLKLNLPAFERCIDSNKYADLIKKDFADAQAAGVNSTPVTFINGQKLVGAQPYPQFQSVIDSLLKTK